MSPATPGVKGAERASQAGEGVRRKTEPQTPVDSAPQRAGDVDVVTGSRHVGKPPAGRIVEEPGPFGVLVDGGVPGPGQIAREAFMQRLEDRVRAVTDAELVQVGRTSKDCPYLEAALAFYRNKPAALIERAISRYAHVERTSAAGLIAAVEKRVGEAVRHWRRTGEILAPPVLVPLVSSGQGSIARAAGLPGPIADPAHPDAAASPAGGRADGGQPLDASIRGRFAAALGTSLDHVRVHRDAGAEATAAGRGAPAFTWGHDIFFAPGAWSPDTIAGQALLAHELAHVAQQSMPDAGASASELEHRASLTAAGALRRLHGGREPAPGPGPGAGLRLQRCGTRSASEEAEANRQYAAPYLDPASQAAAPRVPDALDPTALLSAATAGWSPISDDHILAVQSGDRVFLVPGHYFVSQGAGPLAAAASTDPTRRPVVGMTAVGHGSLQLLNVGGTGILLDAGGAAQGAPGPGGQPVAARAILPGSLAALQASLGIGRIDAVLLMHTHADHVRFLLELIQAGNIQGNRVWIWPGWERATRGPWARVMQALRDPAMAARGFGPSWNPTPLPVRTSGATGTELTTATLRAGNAELSMVTRSADLQAYVGDLTSGSTGTRAADASSMLTRVRVSGAADWLVVGDLRGRTIGQISAQMDAAGTPFAEWVANVRVVVGFHHLGNVETGADTAGYSTLLRELPAGEAVTVVAQAEPSRVNAEFRNRLTASGFRVVVLPRADASALRQFALSQSGRVLAPGASIYEPSGAAAEANARIARMRAAALVLRNPVVAEPLLVTGGRADAQRLAEALEAEADQLARSVRSHRELELAGVESGTRPADYATRAAASETALRSLGTAETRLGQEALVQLARFGPRVGELARLMSEVASTGSSRRELRELISAVGPEVFREVLARYRVPEIPPSLARERAIRASFAELLRQRELLSALQTGPGSVGVVGRGFAAFMAVVELANAIGPYIARARDAANASETQRMMSLLGAIGWWLRLELNVRFEAHAGGRRLAPEEVAPAVARRIWDVTPYGNRVPERELPEQVRRAAPLDRLTIPSVSEWPVGFWALFVERLATVMPTWNEWSRWIDDDPGVGIRAAGDLDTGPWQVLTGTVDWNGTSLLMWERSDMLTTAMRTRLAAVRAGTTAWLRAGLAPPPRPDPNVPSIGRPAADVPTRGRATFKPRATRDAFGPYRSRQVSGFAWSAGLPAFVIYRDAPAPDGMVWATGADEATYRDIRRMRVYRYDPDAVVQLPRPSYTDQLYGEAAGVMPTWYDWTRSHGTPEQRAAAEMVHNQAPNAEWIPYPEGSLLHGSYYGEVRFPSEQPNTSGMILLRRSDLDVQDER